MFGFEVFCLKQISNFTSTNSNLITVDSLYLEHPLSRTSLYLELKSKSLCVSCNVFFLSISNKCEFEIGRVNNSSKN